MTTLRQVESNRSNAQRSTGPRTAAGKTESSRNPLVHGVYALRSVAIPRGLLAEDEDTVEQYLGNLGDALAPRDVLEREQARRIAIDYLRLERVARFEAMALAADGPQNPSLVEQLNPAGDGSVEARTERAAATALGGGGTLEAASRLHARVSGDLDRALVLYAELQKRPQSGIVTNEPAGGTNPVLTERDSSEVVVETIDLPDGAAIPVPGAG